LQLRVIKPRVGRLRELVAQLVQDIMLVKSHESPLLDVARLAYLIGIQEAIAGLDQARVVLGKAIRRIEELGCRTGWSTILRLEAPIGGYLFEGLVWVAVKGKRLRGLHPRHQPPR